MKNTLLLFLSFIFLFCLAQEPSYRVFGKKELSGYDIYDIDQNDKGVIVLGTNNGVYRYDGVATTKLKSPKLKDKSFFGFKRNADNDIFCYNLIGEIYKVTEDSIIPYITIPEEYLTDYFSFEFTDQNEIIFSFVKPILRDKSGKYSMLFEGLDLEYFANTIHKMDDDRIVLFNATTNTLYVHSGTNKWQQIRLKESIPFHHKVSIDSHGEYIYLFDHVSYKVYKVNDQDYKVVTLEPNDIGTRTDLFAVYGQGDFCLSVSGGGLLLFNEKGNPKYGGQTLFDEYVFSGFLTDKDGSYWATTLENAMLYFNRYPIISYVKNPLLKDEFVNRVSFCSNGEMFVGTMSGKIIKENEGRLNLFYDNKPHKINYLEHKANRLYSSKGVFNTKETPLGGGDSPNKSFINNDFEQIDDSYYYATAQGLIYQNKIEHIDTILVKARVHRLEYIDKHKTLWAATNKGLYSYKNSALEKPSILEHLSIPIDLQQYKNKLWIATESDGILLFANNKVLKHLNLDNGLISLEVRKILCLDHKLFISHSKGLQIYDINSDDFQIVNTSDGLLANNIRDFDVYENKIALVTHQGLQKFSFDRLEHQDYKPNIEFTRIASKEGILYDETPELSYSNNSILFQFTSYAFKYDVLYKYRLIKDGNENVGWNKQTFSSHMMHYPSLSPGHYTFQVKAITDHFQESDVISYSFVIKSPFWETIPFWVVVFIVLIKLIHLFYTYTIKKIKEENQIRAELYTSKLTALKSQMNPHFIFNSLNSIQALILKEDVKNSYDYIVKFSTLVRNTLNYSDKSFIDFNDEIKLLSMYLDLEKLRFKDGLNFTLNIHGDIKGYIPPMLIQPFVENAIKHGLLHALGHKTLKIDFKLGDVLQCTVEDNGIGREKSLEIKKRQGRKHNAFSVNALMQRFTILNEIYGSQIGFEIIDLIQENKPVGTRVEIRIPIKTSI